MEVKRCLAFTAVIAAFAACQIIESDVIDQGRIFDKTITFSVSDFEMNDPFETRTAIQSGNKFIWTANDTVGIFPNTGSQVFFEMTSGAGANTATFDGGGWDFKPSAVYRSYYPLVGEFYLDQTNIPVSYEGQKQAGNDNTERIGPYDFMYTPATSAEDGNLNFSYKHLSTILKTKITLPAGHYTKVTLMAEEPVFVLKGHYDLTATPPTIICDTRSSFLSASLDIDLPSETQLVAYILSAPINLSGKTLTVIATDDQGNSYSGLKTIPANYPFLAQNIYSLNYSSVNPSPAPNEIWYTTSNNSDLRQAYHVDNETGNEVDLANCVAPSASNGYKGIIRFTAPITEIDGSALEGQRNLTSITLPDGVETIKTHAFVYCSSLADAHLGISLKVIEPYAFAQCAFEHVDFLPEGLEQIGAFAFDMNSNLNSVEIPSSVNHLGYYPEIQTLAPLGNPFSACPSLESFSGKFATTDGRALVEDTGSATFLVSFATSRMDGMTYVVPEVYGITHWAFSDATIGQVVLPQSLRTIYDNAFQNCRNLTSLTIPSGVSVIMGRAFLNCSSLSMITIKSTSVPRTSGNYSSGDMFDGSNCPIFVESNLLDTYKTTLFWSEYADRYRSRQPEYAIWYTTTDGNSANITVPAEYLSHFSGNTAPNNNPDAQGIGVVKFNINLTEIPEGLFKNCANLQTVMIPDGVQTIGSFSFQGCSSLENVQFGESVKRIDTFAFEDCNLSSIALPNTLESLGYKAFTNNPLTTVMLPESVTTIEWIPFSECGNLQSFTGNNPFVADEGRCLIDPQDGVLLSYASAAIGGEYVIPTGVTEIADGCFEKASFRFVTIPESVQKIGGWNFLNCPNLRTVSIRGESGLSIGHVLFRNCPSLNIINMASTTPPTIEENTFESPFPENVEIHVTGALAFINYTSAEYWTSIPEERFVVSQPDNEIWYHMLSNEVSSAATTYSGFGAEYVNTYAMYNPKRVEPIVELPSSLSLANAFLAIVLDGAPTKIPAYLFGRTETNNYGPDRLDWVSLPTSVTEIGDGAFRGCDQLLLSPYNEDYLVSIGDDAFNGCTRMKTWASDPEPYNALLYTYKCLTSIGDRAFKNCTSLNWPIMRTNGTLTIGNSAFEGSSLPGFVFNGITDLGKSAFKNCKNLHSYRGVCTIGGPMTEIKDSTFYGCNTLEILRIASGSPITTIREYAFSGCASLNTLAESSATSGIYLPRVTVIEGLAFNQCQKIARVQLPELLTAGESSFSYVGWDLDNPVSYDLPKLTAASDWYTFGHCKADDLYLPSIVNLGPFGFGYSSIKNLRFGPNLTSLPSSNSPTSGYLFNSATSSIERNLFFEGTTPPTFGPRTLFTDYQNYPSTPATVLLNLTSIHVPIGCKNSYVTALTNANSLYSAYTDIIIDDLPLPTN